jgi:hypothetical protein
VEVENSSTISNLLFGNDEDASTQIKLFHRLLQQVIHSKYSGIDIPSVLLQYLAVQEDTTKPSSIIQKEDGEVDHEATKVENQSSDIPVELRNGQLQEDPNDLIQAVLSKAHTQLEFLETKMGEVLLKSKDDGSSNNPMPLFEFGNLAQDIIDKTEKQLQTLDKNGHIPSSLRRGLLRSVTKRVQILYKDQLQALRNYYGQRYEEILDDVQQSDMDSDDNKKMSPEEKEQRWATAAEHMTEGFQAAAKNAVPSVDGKDMDNVSHVDVLQGLINDMIEATERRKDEESLADILMEDDEDDFDSQNQSGASKRRRRPKVPKWLERIAARAFVFGVNYLQGWLAWQGIKRAALERDKNQPKFPLF